MKKIVLLTIGFTHPTLEIMEQWMKWFKSIEEKIFESRNSMLEEIREKEQLGKIQKKNVDGY